MPGQEWLWAGLCARRELDVQMFTKPITFYANRRLLDNVGRVIAFSCFIGKAASVLYAAHGLHSFISSSIF